MSAHAPEDKFFGLHPPGCFLRLPAFLVPYAYPQAPKVLGTKGPDDIENPSVPRRTSPERKLVCADGKIAVVVDDKDFTGVDPMSFHERPDGTAGFVHITSSLFELKDSGVIPGGGPSDEVYRKKTDVVVRMGIGATDITEADCELHRHLAIYSGV